jgi:hypothetical protein
MRYSLINTQEVMTEKLEERPVGKSKPAWEHIAMYIKEKG